MREPFLSAGTAFFSSSLCLCRWLGRDIMQVRANDQKIGFSELTKKGLSTIVAACLTGAACSLILFQAAAEQLSSQVSRANSGTRRASASTQLAQRAATRQAAVAPRCCPCCARAALASCKAWRQAHGAAGYCKEWSASAGGSRTACPGASFGRLVGRTFETAGLGSWHGKPLAATT